MKKLFILMSIVAFAAALGLFSCSKVEPILENPADNPETEAPVVAWKVAVSATMGETKALAEDPVTHALIATFETTDNVYVYNRTKNVVDPSPLHPDKNGAEVLLTGSLSNDYDAGDELVFCYNSNSSGNFPYSTRQKGTLATAADYATAELAISAADAENKTITGAATFINMQSIFGFNFTDGSDAIPVRAAEVYTEGRKLVSLIYSTTSPSREQTLYGRATIVADAPVSGPFYAGLRNDYDEDDTYHFRINDGAGHLYSGTKSAPAGKIVNGKYYSSAVTLSPVALPTVTLTADGTPVGPNAPWDETLTMYGWSNVFLGYANYDDLTVSGNTAGCWFLWMTHDSSGGDRTVTLDGATVTVPERNLPFDNQEGTFKFILNGDNAIVTDGSPAIGIAGGSHIVRFQGNGTLTITSSEFQYGCQKGIYDSGYSAENPLQLTAVDGYWLNISDPVDNGDGTFTWVYTVRPAISQLTVYDNTNDNAFVPVSGYVIDGYQKCEFVIPAAKLASMTGGTIHKMSFYLKEVASKSWDTSFTIFMKEVDVTSIDAFSGTGGATTVYTGSFNGTGTTMTLTFSRDFEYHGGNLLVGIYKTTSGGKYASATFYGKNVSGACVQGTSNSLASVTATQRNFLPKTTFFLN